MGVQWIEDIQETVTHRIQPLPFALRILQHALVSQGPEFAEGTDELLPFLGGEFEKGLGRAERIDDVVGKIRLVAEIPVQRYRTDDTKNTFVHSS